MIYPNLTLAPLKARLNKGQELLYDNQSACALDRSIPKEILGLAKTKLAPGFSSTKTIINWSSLQPYLFTHYDELKKELDDAKAAKEKDSSLDTRREKLELAKLKEQVIQLQNINKAKDADFISRRLVVSTLQKIITDYTTEIRRIYENEQPVKTQNLSADKIIGINKGYNDQLFNKLSRPLTEWNTAKDIIVQVEATDETA